MKSRIYATIGPLLAAMAAIALTILLEASFVESTRSIQSLGGV